MELDQNGELISYEQYHAFGTSSMQMHKNHANMSMKRYRYCGKESDEESGLYYYGARYYAAWLCRFMSVDPRKDEYAFQSSYAYAANNPSSLTDVNGEGPGWPDGGDDENNPHAPTKSDRHIEKIESDDMGTKILNQGIEKINSLIDWYYDQTKTPSDKVDDVAETIPGFIAFKNLINNSGQIHTMTVEEQFFTFLSLFEIATMGYSATSTNPVLRNKLRGLIKKEFKDHLKNSSYRKVKQQTVKVPLRSADDLMGVEKASEELIENVSKKRDVVIAMPGSEDLRMLDFFNAEASVGGENMTHILLRENPSKAAILEEFLHGTQYKLGIIDDLGRGGAEAHVKDFMIRHQKMLGLGKEDVEILKKLMSMGL